jgi:hypothetical protein
MSSSSSSPGGCRRACRRLAGRIRSVCMRGTHHWGWACWTHTKPCMHACQSLHVCMAPQLNALLQDAARQQAENSQLHLSLIQEAERADKQQKQHYQQVKKLEDTVAELRYWKQAASDKIQAAERENTSLRRKMDGLVKLNDQLVSGERRGERACVHASMPGVLPCRRRSAAHHPCTQAPWTPRPLLPRSPCPARSVSAP